MQLRSTGTSILAHRPGRAPILIERIDPLRTIVALVKMGFRHNVAREVAYGPLSSEAARRLGQDTGLLQ